MLVVRGHQLQIERTSVARLSDVHQQVVGRTVCAPDTQDMLGCHRPGRRVLRLADTWFCDRRYRQIGQGTKVRPRAVPEQEKSVYDRAGVLRLVVRGVSEGWPVAVASRLPQDEKTVVSIEEFSLVIAA